MILHENLNKNPNYQSLNDEEQPQKQFAEEKIKHRTDIRTHPA